MKSSLLGVGLCLLWLFGHAGFTFWTGGIDPGTTTANIFILTDSFVLLALAIFIFKRVSK